MAWGEGLKDARVEILRDSKGPYGIGAVGIEAQDGPPSSIIMRPDRLPELGQLTPRDTVAYQRIAPNRLGLFKRTNEGGLHQTVHRALLTRAGLPYPAGRDWWSDDPSEQAANRRRFHVYRRSAFKIINPLISEALAVGPEDAVRAARRFPMSQRLDIYRLVARSKRALQLVDTFPALLVAIAKDMRGDTGGEMAFKALELIERGALLKQVAAELQLPMVMSKVKPAIAWMALNLGRVFTERAELIHTYLPAASHAQKRWLHAIWLARELGPPFIEWTARNAGDMGKRLIEIQSAMEDIRDWVRASYKASIPDYVLRAIMGQNRFTLEPNADLVTRRFTPDMSVATVLDLNEDWHRAIVEHGQEGAYREFPEPWCAAGDVNGLEIRPITNSRDLYLEGKVMHHCAASYADSIMTGQCYVYSVTADGVRVATTDLRRAAGRPALGQIRGKCNSQVPDNVTSAVRTWLRSRKEFHYPPPLQQPDAWNPFGQERGQLGDDLPF